jgi:hypothetical protein
VTPTHTHTPSVTTRAITPNCATMTMVRKDNTRIGSRIFLNARMLGSLTELMQLRDHHGPIFVYRIAQPRHANNVLKYRQRLFE